MSSPKHNAKRLFVLHTHLHYLCVTVHKKACEHKLTYPLQVGSPVAAAKL
jgi:hypothetical protein